MLYATNTFLEKTPKVVAVILGLPSHNIMIFQNHFMASMTPPGLIVTLLNRSVVNSYLYIFYKSIYIF